MPCQLPLDCLNETFECMEEDKVTLHSCLLVNRLWCEASVRILWRNIWNFKNTVFLPYSSQILGTLIACLPNESRELLYKNGIFISTPTSKPPLFNYASFCKVLSILDICLIVDDALNNEFKNRNYLVVQETLKMFMNQISSLKKLTYYLDVYDRNIPNFTHFPGAIDCITNLSELKCNSNIHSEIFNQLSKMCNNIQSLTIEFEYTISNELKSLIASQNNLKYLSLMNTYWNDIDWTGIVPSLTKHSNTIIKLHIQGEDNFGPISFITKFTNLQELILSFDYDESSAIEDFKELQYIAFKQLRILKFDYICPKVKILIKFLENNGNNLEEFYVNRCDDSLNLAIAKFCPNLKSLYTLFMSNEIDTLKIIFNSCRKLESIKVWCGAIYPERKKVLEIVAKHSPENFHELKLFYHSEFLSEDLEYFFISWKDRVPQKSLSFIVRDDRLEKNNENKKIIEKYKKLGIIKKFEVINMNV